MTAQQAECLIRFSIQKVPLRPGMQTAPSPPLQPDVLSAQWLLPEQLAAASGQRRTSTVPRDRRKYPRSSGNSVSEIE
eukprot:2311519-Prymnesium_polylepis.1